MSRVLALLACLTLTAWACGGDALWPEVVAPEAPLDLGDGWAVGTPASQGFDPTVMGLLDRRLRERDIQEVDVLLVARNGVLVYEGYFDDATGVDRRHQLNSVTKSVASMVLGAAVQRGLVGSMDQPISAYFPEAADLFAADPAKGEITLGDVLTMTAGLGWDTEDVRSADRDDLHINAAPDAMRYVLEKPLVRTPGEEFFYNSGCSMLMTGLIHNVSGLEADAFAAEYLFGPLGIEDWLWQTTGDGTARGQDGLHLRARDLLKLGQLQLQKGLWEGERLLPGAWVDASTRGAVETDWPTSRYGYQWWTYDLVRPHRARIPDGVVMASGYGGQKLFLVPELDLVAVFFGCTTEGYDCGQSDVVPETVLWNYILRALEDVP